MGVCGEQQSFLRCDTSLFLPSRIIQRPLLHTAAPCACCPHNACRVAHFAPLIKQITNNAVRSPHPASLRLKTHLFSCMQCLVSLGTFAPGVICSRYLCDSQNTFGEGSAALSWPRCCSSFPTSGFSQNTR